MRNYQFVTPATARREMEGKRPIFGDENQIKLIAILEDAKKLVDSDDKYARKIDDMEWHEIKDRLP